MPSIPHLQKNDVSHQLIVNGKPLLMLAGELQNSSLTSAEYMKEVWPKMVQTHVNTVLGCVTWEDIEPEEGKFDFANLDQIVLGAREHGIHLVLLWFGSFKNGRQSRRVGGTGNTRLTRNDRHLDIRARMGQDKPQEIPAGEAAQGWWRAGNRGCRVNLP